VDDRYVPTFPNARHYLGAGDWRPEHFGALEERTLKVVHQHGLLTLVEGPLDLGNGLTILPAPGETPGHQILHMQSGGTEVYFAGDLYHHPLEFAESARNARWSVPEIMQASKAALVEWAARSGALVCFSHVEGLHRVERVDHTVHWRTASFESSSDRPDRRL
jgi:glyoxylase-like metal-dependent hydrolase (beta-lactamase superfamily II)